MNKRILFAPRAAASTLALALTFGFAPVTEAASPVLSVMVKGNEICVRQEKGPMNCFAGSSATKSLPVWSKDGSKITYIEAADKTLALANLVVIDQYGQVIQRMSIKPNVPGEVQSGMRFVESVEWLTRDSIVVSGTVNPSTTEYNVFDLATGKPSKEFFDDGAGATFSPDGRHYASVSGGPHFTPENMRDQRLSVDDMPVFDGQSPHKGQIAFTDKPKWSADGKSVAVPAFDKDKGMHSIVLWDASSKRASMIALPFALSPPEEVFWNGPNLFVKRKVTEPKSTTLAAAPGKGNMATEAWQMSGVNAAPRWKKVDSSIAVNPTAKAKELRAQLHQDNRSAETRDQDFWCSDCDLARLPRRSAP